MSMPHLAGKLSPLLVRSSVEAALEEDLGLAGDITSLATIPADVKAQAVIAARAPGVVAGLDFAKAAIKMLDDNAAFEILAADGTHICAGDEVTRILCNGRALLSAERVALNFMTHLSGIATLTGRFVDAVDGTSASIVCTRKTLPGLRAAEKYAVLAGGGSNHRFGLYDAVLIKDNHIAVAGGIGAAIESALAYAGHMVKIEVEVDTLGQLKAALDYPIDAVLLDNMDNATLEEAVKIADGQITLEASGGVNLETVRGIAETGVDLISVGALTHSAPTLDLGLDIQLDAA